MGGCRGVFSSLGLTTFEEPGAAILPHYKIVPLAHFQQTVLLQVAKRQQERHIPPLLRQQYTGDLLPARLHRHNRKGIDPPALPGQKKAQLVGWFPPRDLERRSGSQDQQDVQRPQHVSVRFCLPVLRQAHQPFTERDQLSGVAQVAQDGLAVPLLFGRIVEAQQGQDLVPAYIAGLPEDREKELLISCQQHRLSPLSQSLARVAPPKLLR